MDKQELKTVVQEMVGAGSCCRELKEAGEKWLAALGAPDEKEAAKNLIAEIKEDISTVDHMIEFYESALAVRIFGREKAAALAAHGYDIRAKGAKHCDCAACSAGLKLLEHERDLLA